MINKQQALSTASSESHEAQHYHQVLIENLNQIKHLMKRGASKQLPCSMIIGPSQSGKSTLIKASGIPTSQTLAENSDESLIWVTKNSIYIDLPGLFLSEQEPQSNWRTIIKSLKSYRRSKPFDSILLTLNLHTLMQQSAEKLTQSVAQLQQTVAYIGKFTQQRTPIYIIFTHTDLIAGFSEYFYHLSAADREQVFGLTLPETKNAEETLAQFHIEYEALLRRLHAQLPQLLHHTRNIEKRKLLHAFPLQIESINSICSYLIEQLFSEKNINNKWIARGVFFVSSQQQGTPIDRLATAIEHNYQLSKPPPQPLHAQQKSYFIKELLQNVIPNDDEIRNYRQALTKKKRWYYGLAYPVITSATVAAIFVLALLFNSNINKLNDAETSLQIYQAFIHNKSSNNLKQLTAALFALHHAEEKANALSTNILTNIPFKHIASIKDNVKKTYRSALTQQFLPAIFQLVEKQISKDKTKAPGKLYTDLTIYLMLGEPEHFDETFVRTWFSQYWSNGQIKQAEINQRLQLIKDAVRLNQGRSLIQPDVVSHARDALNALPTSYLAYLNLKHYSSNHAQININFPKQVFFYTSKNTTIPYIYTKQGFTDAYNTLIPKISKELVHGSWVLGPRNDNGKQTVAELEQQVKTFYYADYVNWWHLYIYNTHPAAFRTFSQATQTFTALSDKQSPLVTIFATVAKNTAMSTDNSALAKAFNHNVASHFSDLHKTSIQSIQQLQPLFLQLNTYFQQLAAASNPDQQAFTLAKDRFTDTGKNDALSNLFAATKQYPQPIKNWLDALAINSWYLVLHHSQLYVNQQWQQNVLNYYRQHIVQRYPLAIDAKNDIVIKDFQQFFAPHGTLDSFVQQYIQPFIDTTGSSWKVKQRNKLSLLMDRQTLSDLLRATIIRNMFFSKDSSQMNVTFNLQAVTFEPIVKNLILNINGQRVFDYQGSSKISRFFWPGQTGQKLASLQITTINGQHFSVTETGDWAWFKLLSKANLAPLNDTQHYSLIFDLNGSAAKYELMAQNPINPFIPGILNNFRLPDKIVS